MNFWVWTSSDESLNQEKDTFGYGITTDEPEIDSWVGVKLEKGNIQGSENM